MTTSPLAVNEQPHTTSGPVPSILASSSLPGAATAA
ncbi:hypothetical protein JOD53_001883 [Brevibacterium luteolum]|nr:hypothetical protein [Brevibacterium luteolum]